jgi:hypothetical protein
MKILVSIISSSKHTDSRIKFIKDSWLKDVEDYVILSDHSDIDSKTYQITENSSYESNVEKNFKSFKFFYDNYSDFDWFINLDDDTFLNYNNLKEYIQSLSEDEIFMTGFINYGTLPSDTSLNYCSGGAGYVFNKKTLEILKDINNLYNLSMFADANIGMYCRDKNIKLISSDLFHPRDPEFHNCSIDTTKKSISFHYVVGQEMINLYNRIFN